MKQQRTLILGGAHIGTSLLKENQEKSVFGRKGKGLKYVNEYFFHKIQKYSVNEHIFPGK